jgi:hypothetical protein
MRPARARCGNDGDRAMTTYVLRNGALIEKHLAPPRAAGRSPHVLSDIAPFKTQDGTPITSRAALREYERVNGVRQVGTDWTGLERPAFWDRHMAREKRKDGNCHERG